MTTKKPATRVSRAKTSKTIKAEVAVNSPQPDKAVRPDDESTEVKSSRVRPALDLADLINDDLTDLIPEPASSLHEVDEKRAASPQPNSADSVANDGGVSSETVASNLGSNSEPKETGDLFSRQGSASQNFADTTQTGVSQVESNEFTSNGRGFRPNNSNTSSNSTSSAARPRQGFAPRRAYSSSQGASNGNGYVRRGRASFPAGSFNSNRSAHNYATEGFVNSASQPTFNQGAGAPQSGVAQPNFSRQEREDDAPTEMITGFLDTSKDGHGVVRVGFAESERDAYISTAQIRRLRLLPGD